MKLKNKILTPDSPGAQMSGAEMSSAQTAAPKRTLPYKKLWQKAIKKAAKALLHAF